VAHQVGIVGASGYGGAELVRLLGAHPGLDLTVIAAHTQAGEPVRRLFPNIVGDVVFDPIDLDRLAGLDLVFIATPHAPALELAPQLVEAGTRVVDLSAGFRLAPAAFATWYGEEHPRPDLAPEPASARAAQGDGAPAPGARGSVSRAVYGLTEFARQTVAGARLVANPGCYPTATLLALVPLAPLVVPGSIVVDAKSGTSGAGRGLREDLHHPHAHGDVTAYGAPTHRHTGEIETWLSALGGEPLGAVSFTPHLVPTVRGLLATCYADLRGGVTEHDIASAYADAYASEAFVHVREMGSFPHTKALSGSNGCQLAFVTDPRTGRVVVSSAIDNLGKGAAGQALQNANLMLGLEEPTGLSAVGVYP
jgi:N-acetyl-gamma-glutamyl-phosphate reductase